MKTKVLILALLFCPIRAFSYVYSSDCSFVECGNSVEGWKDSKFGLVWGDSLVGDTKYMKLYESDYLNWNAIMLMGWYNEIKLYRSEEKRIYRYDEKSGTDKLMYDFGLSVGDKITNYDGTPMKVDKIVKAMTLPGFDSLADGYKYNADKIDAIFLSATDDSGFSDIWVEGIGSLKTGLFCQSDLKSYDESSLVYSQAYISNYYMRFSYVGAVDFGDFKISPFKISQRSSYDLDEHYFFYENDTSVVQYEFLRDTLHVKGIMSDFPCIYNAFVKIDESTINCIVASIETDFGFDSPQLYEFETKIPRFKPGTYTIKSEGWKGMAPDTTLTCHGKFKYTTIEEPEGNYLNKFWTIQCFDKNSDGNMTMRSITLTDYTFNDRENNTITFGDYSYVLYNVMNSHKNLKSNLYFREKDAKVYRYDEQSSTEHLAFDFTLSAGDSFEKSDGTKWEVYEKGQAKDLPSYFDKFYPDRIMLKLREKGNESHEDIWIEGVGSIYTGILDAGDIDSDSTFVESEYRIFSYDNNDCSFFNIDNCSYKSCIGETYRLEAEDIEDGEFVKWDTNGRKIETYFIDDTLCIRDYKFTYADVNTVAALINGNIINVYVNEAYSLSIAPAHLYRIDGKIPGFQQGEYTIHFPQSSKTDTTLTCSGPATGIHEITIPLSKPTDNVIYDLSGRQLNAIPERGIYIRNGKKYIVR